MTRKQKILTVSCALARGTGQNKPSNTLFDDCQPGNAANAMRDLNTIRSGQAPRATVWPHMRALSCLVTEWYVLTPGKNNTVERNTFQYGHIQSLVNRIRGLIEDPQFTSIVNVSGSAGLVTPLDMAAESAELVRNIFGPPTFGQNDWSIHIN